jgi:hypothetical protein
MPYSAASKLCGWCYSRRNTATRRRNKSDMQADNNILLFGQWFRNKQGNSSHASTQPAADAALKTPQARPLLRVTQRALLLFFFPFTPAPSPLPTLRSRRRMRLRSFVPHSTLCCFFFFCCLLCSKRRRRCLQLAFFFFWYFRHLAPSTMRLRRVLLAPSLLAVEKDVARICCHFL